MNLNDLVSRFFFLTIIYIVGATPDDKVNITFKFVDTFMFADILRLALL